jgi:hypothetical protein
MRIFVVLPAIAIAVIGFLIFSSGVMGQPQQTIDPKEIQEIHILNDKGLFEYVRGLIKDDIDVDAANSFFIQQGLEIFQSGLTQVNFLYTRDPDHPPLYTIIFIPYVTPQEPPQKEIQRAVVFTQKRTPGSPRSREVSIVTITTAPQTPGMQQVQEEYTVRGGKPNKLPEGEGRMKNWFKCLAGGCVPALTGCAYGNGSYLTCTTLWCGGAGIVCAILQLF